MEARRIAYVAVFVALYAVLGQVIRFLPNPMVPGAIIAINMTVVVVAGILLGVLPGLLVGALGSLLDGLIRSSLFQLWAIGPHAVMGAVAGLLARWNPRGAALAIVVGHALNIIVYLIVGLLPRSQLAVGIFWTGLLFETVVGIIVIWLAVAVLRPVLRPQPA